MGRCEPRTNENDPGLITLPEGIDELGDAVKSEFDVTTKQVCRALQCTRPFVLSHCKHIRHIYVSGDWSDKVGLGPGGGFIWSRKELRDLAVNGTVERRTRVVGAADILAGSREAMDWLEAAAAEAAELGSDPRRSRADEVKFRELSREVFERVYLPDEWKPAYNAARLKRSQMHWVDLGEHPRSFDELGTVWRTTADRKGYGDTDEDGRGRIDATERCGSPSPCPTARPRSCMRPTRRHGRGSTTSWRQFCLSSCCRRTTSGMSCWETTTWSPMNSSCTASPAAENMPVLQNPTESRMST